MTELPEFKIGDIRIKIPSTCPEPVLFETIVTSMLLDRFGSAESAQQCRDKWLAIRIIPEPFASNEQASSHYESAMLALNPEARAWCWFEEAVNTAFRNYEDDGSAKEPAIPGWTPDWISLTG